ncbi:unnamed protein product, partial [Nesidiocoris tenuis]
MSATRTKLTIASGEDRRANGASRLAAGSTGDPRTGLLALGIVLGASPISLTLTTELPPL